MEKGVKLNNRVAENLSESSPAHGHLSIDLSPLVLDVAEACGRGYSFQGQGLPLGLLHKLDKGGLFLGSLA